MSSLPDILITYRHSAFSKLITEGHIEHRQKLDLGDIQWPMGDTLVFLIVGGAIKEEGVEKKSFQK